MLCVGTHAPAAPRPEIAAEGRKVGSHAESVETKTQAAQCVVGRPNRIGGLAVPALPPYATVPDCRFLARAEGCQEPFSRSYGKAVLRKRFLTPSRHLTFAKGGVADAS